MPLLRNSMFILLALSALACGSSDEEDEETCAVDESYDPSVLPADFSPNVTNPLFPLPVGRTWTYKEGIQDVVVTVV